MRSGLIDLLDVLSTMRDAAGDLTPTLGAVADDWLALQEEMFATGGGPVGGWEPLSHVTAMAKVGGDLLEESGGLRDSLTDTSAKWAVRNITADEVTVGTRAPHAHLHDRGARGGQLPSRPLRPDEDTLARRWIPLIGQRLTGSPPERLGL